MFLAGPQAYIDGTKMSFVGIKAPQDRINLIAWLRQQSSSPAPIPAAEPQGRRSRRRRRRRSSRRRRARRRKTPIRPPAAPSATGAAPAGGVLRRLNRHLSSQTGAGAADRSGRQHLARRRPRAEVRRQRPARSRTWRERWPIDRLDAQARIHDPAEGGRLRAGLFGCGRSPPPGVRSTTAHGVGVGVDEAGPRPAISPTWPFQNTRVATAQVGAPAPVAQGRSQRLLLVAVARGQALPTAMERLLHQARTIEPIGAAPAPEIGDVQEAVRRPPPHPPRTRPTGVEVALHHPARAVQLGEPALPAPPPWRRRVQRTGDAPPAS